MAVWRLGHNSTVCGSTAVAEARSMAQDEDYLSAISYMLAESLKLGRKKGDLDMWNSQNCYDHFSKKCAIFRMKEKPARKDLKEYQPAKAEPMGYPSRCLIKGQTLQRSEGQCLGDYIGDWVRFFGYPKEIQMNYEGADKMGNETREMLRLLKDVLDAEAEEIHWPLKITEVRSRLVRFDG